MLATLTAVMVPLWCCCALQQHAMAADPADTPPSATAEQGCCSTAASQEQPASDHRPGKQACDCSQDKVPPPPALKVDVKPTAELLQPLLMWLPLLYSLELTDADAHVEARDEPPAGCSPTLFSQHCLLLN